MYQLRSLSRMTNLLCLHRTEDAIGIEQNNLRSFIRICEIYKTIIFFFSEQLFPLFLRLAWLLPFMFIFSSLLAPVEGKFFLFILTTNPLIQANAYYFISQLSV